MDAVLDLCNNANQKKRIISYFQGNGSLLGDVPSRGF
jgi:hypothetical protein